MRPTAPFPVFSKPRARMWAAGSILPRFSARTPTFGPGDIAALSPSNWYRSSNATSAAWTDAGFIGATLVQSTDTNRPTKQVNGALLFDGTDNYMETSAFSTAIAQPFTEYLLYKQVTYTANDTILDRLTSGPSTAYCAIYQNGGSPIVKMFCSQNGPTDLTPPLDGYYALAAVFNGASSIMRRDLTTPLTGDVGVAFALDGITMGARNDLANFANVEIMECIVFPSAHTALQTYEVNRYLMRRGGL